MVTRIHIVNEVGSRKFIQLESVDNDLRSKCMRILEVPKEVKLILSRKKGYRTEKLSYKISSSQAIDQKLTFTQDHGASSVQTD